LIFVATCILFFLSLSFADDFTLTGYFEAGKKTQAEDFEEEDDDREYIYQNYHVKLRHRVSIRSRYELGSFIYNKDYKSRDSLDNISKIFFARGSHYLNKHKEESLKLDIKLRYKEKRFRNTPSSEYNQIMFLPKLTYERKNSYSVYVSTGINNFDYINTDSTDQLKFSSKLGVKRYLFEKNLLLLSSYKFETTVHKRADRHKDKSDFMFGSDFICDTPLIYKITARALFGQKDTKDDDERDEDFDYKYRQFYVKTEHRVKPHIKTDLKYQFFKKDYVTADLDHSGFYVRNRWKYILFDDPQQLLSFQFAGKHKEVQYAITSDSDFKKETLELQGTYRRKKDWITSASLQGNLYDYQDSTRDKNRYYARISFEKLFPELYVKYKYTDNKQRNNTEEEAARLAFQYTF
jgi:hypothetical protein